MKIFLSYASEDKDAAEQVYLNLRKDRHRVFFDRTDLPAGSDFDSRIRNAIKKSELFIFLISPDSVANSSYALTELKLAREKWSEPVGRVLPVMLRETSYDSIPNYLKTVTVLEPEGSVAAEVAGRVENWRPGFWKWLSNPRTSRAKRMILSFLIFGIVGLVLVEALYWVRDRQQLSKEPAAQAQPTSVTRAQPPPTPAPTINPVSPPSAKEIAEEIAKRLNLSPTQISQTQRGLREILIPANDQTPPNICDDQKDIVSRFANRDSMKLALLGPAAALYPQREKPVSLITIAGQSVLGVEGARTGIVLNATLRDETGRLLAEI